MDEGEGAHGAGAARCRGGAGRARRSPRSRPARPRSPRRTRGPWPTRGGTSVTASLSPATFRPSAKSMAPTRSASAIAIEVHVGRDHADRAFLAAHVRHRHDDRGRDLLDHRATLDRRRRACRAHRSAGAHAGRGERQQPVGELQDRRRDAVAELELRDPPVGRAEVTRARRPSATAHRSRSPARGRRGRHRAARAPAAEHPQLHRREVLGLVDDDVAERPRRAADHGLGFVEQREVGPASSAPPPAWPSPCGGAAPARPGRADRPRRPRAHGGCRATVAPGPAALGTGQSRCDRAPSSSLPVAQCRGHVGFVDGRAQLGEPVHARAPRAAAGAAPDPPAAAGPAPRTPSSTDCTSAAGRRTVVPSDAQPDRLGRRDGRTRTHRAPDDRPPCARRP